MHKAPVLVHNTHIIHTTTHTHTYTLSRERSAANCDSELHEGWISSLKLLPGMQGHKPSAHSRTYFTAR